MDILPREVDAWALFNGAPSRIKLTPIVAIPSLFNKIPLLDAASSYRNSSATSQRFKRYSQRLYPISKDLTGGNARWQGSFVMAARLTLIRASVAMREDATTNAAKSGKLRGQGSVPIQ